MCNKASPLTPAVPSSMSHSKDLFNPNRSSLHKFMKTGMISCLEALAKVASHVANTTSNSTSNILQSLCGLARLLVALELVYDNRQYSLYPL